MTATVPPEVYPPDSGSLEGRTSLVLKFLALIHLAGIVLALVPIPVSTLYTVSFHAAGALLAVVYLVLARAIDRRRPWAIRAVRPMLVVLLASGVVTLITSVAEGELHIPFEGIGALFALLSRPDATLTRRTELRTAGVLAGVAVGLGVMLFGKPVFDWGGTLDQHVSDLVAAIHVDCGPAGAGLPATIPVRYEWSWAWQGPLPSGLDTLVIGWTGSDSSGRPLYTVGAIPDNPKGIYPGRLGEPSITMAKAVKAESQGSWQWGVELGEYGLAPGAVDLELSKTVAAPPQGSKVTITATWVHLGLWRSDTVATCSG